MKTLSICQPWAWLIVNGYKNHENRTWNTHHRGDTLIHASLKFDRLGYHWVRENFPGIKMPDPDQFERGGIVGKAILKRVVTESPNKFFFGPFGFYFEQARPLPFRPCKGKLGFFDTAPEGINL